jgi:NADH-quinone oxidoreductase subunit N
MEIPAVNFTPILPEIVLVGTALLVLLIAAYSSSRKGIAILSIVGFLVAASLSFVIKVDPPQTFQGMLVVDHYALYVNLVILLAAFLALLLSYYYTPQFTKSQGGYYALILLATAGMMTMAAATDLVTVFLALEVLSLSLYVLAGYNRHSAKSGEAALKYFLLGAFSSAFFLYGIALMYGATGTTNLARIVAGKNLQSGSLLWYAGGALLLVGFSFKISVVPFHMWTPDVYQGSPTPVTAFMAVGAKAAGFAALMRVLLYALGGMKTTWAWAFAILALLTMTLGNLAALRQTSVKRMLAYSSIAHAGYMLVGLTAGTQRGVAAVLFYLLSYAFMNIGAFAVLVALEHGGEQDVSLDEMVGLSRRKPLLAAAMAVFMLSLAGIPPLVGFMGKLYVFSAAVDAGWVWLAVLAMLNSVISAYYYLRVVVNMYMHEAEEETAPSRAPWTVSLALWLTALGTIIIGIVPGPVIVLAQQSMRMLLGG